MRVGWVWTDDPNAVIAAPPQIASRYRSSFKMTDYANLLLLFLLWRLYAVS